MRYESLNKNSNPTKSNPTMNTSIMNPLPADNAGIIGMLKELIRSVSTEVFHELIEGVRTLKRLNIRQFQVLKMMSGAVGR